MFKFAAVVMAVCGLVLTSCEQSDSKDGPFEVALKKTSVSPDKGTQFVSVKCAGDWTLSLVAEDGADIDWARLNATSGKGNKTNVQLSYDGNEAQVSRTLVVVLSSGSKSETCSMVQQALGAAPEPEEPEEPEKPEEPDAPTDLETAQWLELPAMDDPNLEYYSHSFKMDGVTYRNYTFGWSQKDYTSVWVAYPLCTMYTNKKANRTNKWAYDPILGPTLSPAPFDGYAGNYDRGHMLPSADRLCCYDANVQTFYSTNIVPQDATHNQNIWESLESKIRTIANSSDTTYIVTGVMIKNPIGYTTDSTKDEYGNRRNTSDLKTLPVPSHFFKAVLRYSKTSTLGQWNAAGFYYEHTSNAQQQLISIDKLEELTGIDFFVNLASVVGETQAARIEASVPNASLWN